MARKPKDKPRPRKPRSKRLVEASLYQPDHQQEAGYWDWLNNKHRAMQILNAHPERPYWASIEYNGSVPVAGYFPVTMFRRYGRVYYGFLSRAHRDGFVADRFRDNPRKEYTGPDGRSPA